ncbi:hypothetical protein PNF31_08435 [Priestia megaterium]|uniref:hypothetical protein n=1 Tax=Priestia megaterium TaxID=1404 RepID=UPI00234EAD70|nr:hypothetical protein [Priestia megaterium]MDC7720828.1 hypothetical protein [Priestia megaterium]
MIGGQDEDSCGKSGTGETPQEHTRRGGSPPAESEVLHGNQQRFISLCPNLILHICHQ